MILAEAYEPLRGYMGEDGRIQRFPGKRQKKLQQLLFQYLAEKFEKGRTYTEPQVNVILNDYHSFEDPASLRRLMFGMGLLDRTIDGRAYWVA